MSRLKAIKYAKLNAKEMGIDGENFGASGVDDNTAYNAFIRFMSDDNNLDSGTYHSICWDLYLWNSVAAVRKMEHSWGLGLRPPRKYVDLIIYGYEHGSTFPKHQRGEKLTYEIKQS